MKLFKNKIFTIFLSFMLGSIITYFLTSYFSSVDNKKVSNETGFKVSNVNQINSRIPKKNEGSDPFAEMEKVHDQMLKRMDSVFGNSMFKRGQLRGSLFNDSFFNSSSLNDFAPDDIQVEEYEEDNHKVFEISIENMDKNSIKINIADGMISISGEIRKTEDKSLQNSHSVSSHVMKFSRSFNIPHGVNANNAKIDTKEDKIIIKFPKDRA